MSAQGTISPEKLNEKSQNNGNYAEITNLTDDKILVYGPPRATDGGSYDTSWYILHPGAATPEWWQCSGFFIPSDRSFSSGSGSSVQGPAAVRYNPGKSITLISTGNQYLAKGDSDDGIFYNSEINWSIPKFTCEECQAMNKPRYEISQDKRVMRENIDTNF